MSAFGGLILTNKGRNLQAKAETGIELKFTRIGVGDGELGSESILELNSLKNEVKSLDIKKLKSHSQGHATIGSVISSQDITAGFYFREIGLFATDPNEGEILYCYGNAGVNAEYIPVGGGPDIVEKSIDIIAIIGNATNVSAVLNQSLIYETPEGAQEKATLAESNAKAYVDKELSKKVNKVAGKVLSTNDFTNDFKDKLEGLQNFDSSEIDEHLSSTSNPHGVFAEQVGAETPEGAQAKANGAEQKAKQYIDEHIALTNNPHGVTAEQIGAATKSEVNKLFANSNNLIKEYKVIGANGVKSKDLVNVKNNEVFNNSHFTQQSPIFDSAAEAVRKTIKITDDKYVLLIQISSNLHLMVASKNGNKILSFSSATEIPFVNSGYRVLPFGADITPLDETSFALTYIEYKNTNDGYYKTMLRYCTVNGDSICFHHSRYINTYTPDITNKISNARLITLTRTRIVRVFSVTDENKWIRARVYDITPTSIVSKGSQVHCGEWAIDFDIIALSSDCFVTAYYATSWYKFGYSRVFIVDSDGVINGSSTHSFRHENGDFHVFVSMVKLSETTFAISYYGIIKIGTVNGNNISYSPENYAGLNQKVNLLNCGDGRVIGISNKTNSSPSGLRAVVFSGSSLDEKSENYDFIIDCKSKLFFSLGNYSGYVFYIKHGDSYPMYLYFTYPKVDLDDIGIVINDVELGEIARVLLSGVSDEFSGVNCGDEYSRLRTVGRGLAENSIVVKPFWEV